MRRLSLIFLSLCALSLSSRAQELIASVGMSIQNQAALKSYQERVINFSTFVPLKSTQSFPSYLQYQLSFRSPVTKRIKLGGTMYLTSTAARSAASDYSGEVVIDQKLWCVGAGGYFSYALANRKDWSISVYAIPGLDLSGLKITNTVNSGVYHENEQTNADAISAVLEGGFEFQYNISERLMVNLNAGGHFSNRAMLVDDYEQSVTHVNWSGFKIMTGIGYRF